MAHTSRGIMGIREESCSTQPCLLHADARTARIEAAPVTSSPLSLASVLRSIALLVRPSVSSDSVLAPAAPCLRQLRLPSGPPMLHCVAMVRMGCHQSRPVASAVPSPHPSSRATPHPGALPPQRPATDAAACPRQPSTRCSKAALRCALCATACLLLAFSQERLARTTRARRCRRPGTRTWQVRTRRSLPALVELQLTPPWSAPLGAFFSGRVSRAPSDLRSSLFPHRCEGYCGTRQPASVRLHLPHRRCGYLGPALDHAASRCTAASLSCCRPVTDAAACPSRFVLAAAPRSCYSACLERHCGGSRLHLLGRVLHPSLAHAASRCTAALNSCRPVADAAACPGPAAATRAALPPTSRLLARRGSTILLQSVRGSAVAARCDSFVTVVGTPGRVDASAPFRPCLPEGALRTLHLLPALGRVHDSKPVGCALLVQH